MTVSNITSQIPYTLPAGIVTTGQSYTFPFRILLATDLVVTAMNLTTGLESTLLLGSHFTVAGTGNYSGGSVTLLNDWQNNTILIERVEPITQLTSFVSQGAFFPELHEVAFDKLTMIAQQLRDLFQQTVMLPPNIPSPGNVPAPVSGSVLGWVSGSWAWLSGASVSLAANLLTAAAGMGTSLLMHLAPFTGAIGRLLVQVLAGQVAPEDFGAVGNGVANDGPAIQSAMAAAISYGVPLVFRGVTYAYSTYIAATLGANQQIVIRGNGATLLWTGTDAGSYPAPPLFFFHSILIAATYNVNGNGTKCIVSDLNVVSTLSGAFSDSRTRGCLCGFMVRYLAQASLTNVNVSGFPFINITAYYIDQLLALECSGNNSCYCGLVMQSCSDAKVIGGVYNANGGSDPTIEGYGVSCSSVTAHSTDLGRDNFRVTIFGVTAIGNVGKGIDAHDADELSITHCKVRDFTLVGIYADNQGGGKNVSNIIITDNEIDGYTGQSNPTNTQYGIQVGGYGDGASYIGSVIVHRNNLRNITLGPNPSIGIQVDSPNSVVPIQNVSVCDNNLENVCSGAALGVAVRVAASIVNFVGSGTIGTPVLNINSFSTGLTLAVGSIITGPGIPAGATIQSFGSYTTGATGSGGLTGCTVNLSANLTATITSGSLSGVLQAVNVSFCRNNIVQNLACGTLLQISNAANTIIADNNIYSNSVASVGIYTTALGKFTVTNNRLSGGFSGTPLTFYAVDGNVAKGNTLNGAHLPDSTAGIFEDWLPACPTGTGGAMLNGTWSQGSVVHNTNPSNAVGQAAGWLRMTTGTTNVLGTGTGAFDWRPYGVTA